MKLFLHGASLFAFVLVACNAPLPRAVKPASPATTEPSPAATTAPTTLPSAFEPIDPFVQVQQIGRGVNLGNALEAPVEGAWGITLEEKYFQLIEDAGFNSVRIPIRWSAHADREKPYTIDPKFFARVDWAVEQALKRGLTPIINMHHYEEIFVNPEAERERFITLWDQIAAHYEDSPPQLIFELLNEPNGALTASIWNKLFAETLTVVRKTNPARNVVIGPVDWNSVSRLPDLKLPEDDSHIIATFHYYLPFQFTHQGAEWVDGAKAWLGTEWKGRGAEKAYIEFDLDRAAQWAKENHRPIWLGEFGAYSKADIASRQRWTDFVARQAEKRSVAWSYWEFGAGFGVYDPLNERWNQPILSALIPK